MPGVSSPVDAAVSPAVAVPPAVARRAVEWLVALQDEPVASALHEDWQRWRAAHPDHERAWQRIEAVNGKLRHLGAPVSAAIAHATLAPPRSPARRHAVTSLAVLLFGGAAAWTFRDDIVRQASLADYRTYRGERRSVTLDDGTVLGLNTDSAIKVDFGATERRVRLLSGEVLVTTARDAAARPFLVETAQGEAMAIGTRYLVRLQEAATEIAVFDGAVRIMPRHATTPPLLLRAGQQSRFTEAAIEIARPADQDRSAWTDGFLVAKGMRLADFLAELDRYSTRRLSCDPAVADLRVSGSYPLADIDTVLDTVATMLSLQCQAVTRFWGLQTVGVNLAARSVPRRAKT